MTQDVQRKEQLSYPKSLTVYGFEIRSRCGCIGEISEMLKFAELCNANNLARHIKNVFYESKLSLCYFEFTHDIPENSAIAGEIYKIADATISQFDWFGACWGRGTIKLF